MFTRPLLWALCAALALSACDDKEAKLKKTAEAKAKEKKSKPTIRDVSTDTSFQAYVGHLRAAVGKRDRAELATLMSSHFGYKWEQDDSQPTRPEDVFTHWDQNGLWPELERLLASRFAPFEDKTMVAPLEFAAAPETYRDHRLGIKWTGNSWRFHYFISGEDVLQ